MMIRMNTASYKLFLTVTTLIVYCVLSVTGQSGNSVDPSAGWPPSDLILLDWHMPVLAGYDVLRLLKGDFSGVQFPWSFVALRTGIVILTAVYDLGGNAFIIKSNTLNHLTASIGNLMKQWLI